MSLESTGERNRAVHSRNNNDNSNEDDDDNDTKEQSTEINILARANCVRIRVQQSKDRRKKQPKRKINKQTKNCDSNEKESILGRSDTQCHSYPWYQSHIWCIIPIASHCEAPTSDFHCIFTLTKTT